MQQSLIQPKLVLPEEAFVESVMKHIETGYTNKAFNTEVLAEIMGVSAKQLIRKCKAVLNSHPEQLIENYRLRKARLMFNSGATSVTETATAVGFTDVDRFVKQYNSVFSENIKK
ncbi:MAG: AraC family transcriptional regulator [Bacteroidales bacterium]|nr:AraC family transcriptional regulator [Bacteroidales bacterium]